MGSPPRARALVALAIVAGLAMGARSGLGAADLLCLAPALALAAMLLWRGYPGERLLSAALARRRHGRRARPSREPRRALRFTGPGVPRGGLLMARALAVRPPPLPAPLAS
jgi:hypothetical protein